MQEQQLTTRYKRTDKGQMPLRPEDNLEAASVFGSNEQGAIGANLVSRAPFPAASAMMVSGVNLQGFVFETFCLFFSFDLSS
jgi:hypothetical protein